MNELAISVKNIGKQYQLGSTRRDEGLRHLIQNFFTTSFRLIKPLRAPEIRNEKKIFGSEGGKEFWSLSQVSFDIMKGEVVGVIGRNGAGKSTLLKILSRITEPTTGRIEISGRVSSLLEVGTGFHPELTGRENIFLNGAILGMTRAEIKSKFEEIVDFAEIGRFLDTPVKRYSSGMYVRLAFAVAAHLDPEVLIVDEVLAVGDAEFQQKCLGKMRDVRTSGRTVLFVSHNMVAVKQLCSRCILLSNGTVVAYGATDAVVAAYASSFTENRDTPFRCVTGLYGLQLSALQFFRAADAERCSTLTFAESYELKLEFNSPLDALLAGVVVEIRDLEGTLITSICSVEEGIGWIRFAGMQELCINLPELRLFPNKYRLDVAVYALNEQLLRADSICIFEVEPNILNGSTWPYQTLHGGARISNGGSTRTIKSDLRMTPA